LWLAESLVNPGSLGLFAGSDHGTTRTKMDDEDDEDDDEDQPWVLPFEDVAINLVDYASSNTTTFFPLEPLLWNAYHTYSTFDANQVDSVIPGIGMLAQSFAGEDAGKSAVVKVELDHEGLDRARIGAGNASAGAFSHIQSVRFVTSSKGDSKTCPVSLGQELVLDPKLRLGPERYDQLQNDRRAKKPNVKATKSSDTRSASWLQQNAVCLDHIKAGKSLAVPHQRGAFTRRPLSEGQRITAFPVVALDRKHLKIRHNSSEGEDEASRYHQLLLNYAFGHADSTLLLFPLGPSVNLVNHPGQGEKANVALRWYGGGPDSSPLAGFHEETLLDAPPSQVLQRQSERMKDQAPPGSTVLMMELYALRDLEPDEELLLDYGSEWETAWDRHQQDWNLARMTLSASTQRRSSTKSAYEYEQDYEIYTRDEPRQYPADSIQPRCYVDVDKLTKVDDEGWYEFVASQGDLIDWTQPCDVLSAKFDRDGDKESYRVIVSVDQDRDDSTAVEYQVKNVPWSAITFVDQSYQGLQFHSRAFRHEIQLPDDVFPPAWKDMAASLPDAKCGLYMAESAIPNSGVRIFVVFSGTSRLIMFSILASSVYASHPQPCSYPFYSNARQMGMYSARFIPVGDRIFYGDVVIQVEDYDLNQRLRRAYHGIHNESKAPWLLNSYYWDPSVTLAQNEASDVQSIIPGLGMLANSHPGLVNAEQMPPHRRDYHLHRAIDIGAGASSSYHDIYFDAEKDIQSGEEIFVRYGGEWFRPSYHYRALESAQEILGRFSVRQ
jgi:hypothetical protein